ncbi:MAG: flavin-dependent dehydrogenase, partial [Cyanobacteria bacterium CAN_BIN43]|nr:flavin-dependent dehydrogenase [Cyanobacteria bacterium CAN_BIN43]
MREVLYIEVPTPDTASVRHWLHHDFNLEWAETGCQTTRDGLRFIAGSSTMSGHSQTSSEQTQTLSKELSIFVWSFQRTTYLKVFCGTAQSFPHEAKILQHLVKGLRTRFPHQYPEPPAIDLSQQSIFEALAADYPKTVQYFRTIPNGEYDLTRVYWWEQRWRQGVRSPQQPQPVIFEQEGQSGQAIDYDLIYVGGALGVIHAAVMAQLGYRVLLIERLPFGWINREWNISRNEFQSLIDLGLFTPAEFEAVIAREYVDGFHKFFDANNPPQAKAPVLHTP